MTSSDHVSVCSGPRFLGLFLNGLLWTDGVGKSWPDLGPRCVLVTKRLSEAGKGTLIGKKKALELGQR